MARSLLARGTWSTLSLSLLGAGLWSTLSLGLLRAGLWSSLSLSLLRAGLWSTFSLGLLRAGPGPTFTLSLLGPRHASRRRGICSNRGRGNRQELSNSAANAAFGKNCMRGLHWLI